MMPEKGNTPLLDKQIKLESISLPHVTTTIELHVWFAPSYMNFPD